MRNDTKVDKHSARLAHVAYLMLFKLKRSVESTRDVTDVIQCIQTWLTEQETGSLIVHGCYPPDLGKRDKKNYSPPKTHIPLDCCPGVKTNLFIVL